MPEMADDSKTMEGNGYAIGTRERSVSELIVPISILGAPEDYRPFASIDDLNEAQLQLALPEAVARHVVQIDLIANSEYGFEQSIRILSHAVGERDWNISKGVVSNNFKSRTWPEQIVWHLSSGDGQRKWAIDLDDAVKINRSSRDDADILRYAYQ